MEETIRIWIGSETKTRIPCEVLKYSILKHTKSQVEFHVNEGESWTTEAVHGQGTGFSLQRWRLAEEFDYKGKIIYLDADQLCLADISELWNFGNSGESSVYCTYQPDKWFPEPRPNTSVMLIDCEHAKTDWPKFVRILEYLKTDKNRHRYVKVMHALHLKTPAVKIPTEWNHLNIVNMHTKIIHYTREHEQPWYFPENPCRKIWEKYLSESIQAKKVTKEQIKEECNKFVPHRNGFRGFGFHPYWKKYAN